MINDSDSEGMTWKDLVPEQTVPSGEVNSTDTTNSSAIRIVVLESVRRVRERELLKKGGKDIALCVNKRLANIGRMKSSTVK